MKTKQPNRQALHNPEINDKAPALAKLLKEKMSHSIPSDNKNIFEYNAKNQPKIQMNTPEGRVMEVTALETRNGQATMFSKSYNAETAG